MVWVRELADVVMSTGMAVAKAHPGYSAIADRVVPFYPPVDLARFRPPHPQQRAKVRASWGVPSDAPVVGSVANINAQKGIVELVRAFARVRVEHPTARLVLVGAEYPDHADYSAAVRVEMALHGLVEGRDAIFVGERDDVERQLAGMDVVALAAARRSEGITTAVLEAMAVGLAVVVTDVGALREAVEDGLTGFVIGPDDAAGFALALGRLLEDSALRASVGKAARTSAKKRFGVDSCADAHAWAYEQALAAHGKARPRPIASQRSVYPKPSAPSTVVQGVQVFSGGSGTSSHDALEHVETRHKNAQVDHFDRVGEEEFEVERPHGSPRLYKFLLGEKFRRAMQPIRQGLVGSSALTVCGGSGLDGEYLSRAGATVLTSDVSLGAASRAKQRSERYDLGIESIVAHVEDLPFVDQSVDLVAVHDGLHHLSDPYAGLAEMARVARRWVVVTEPARASVTRLAVRLGLALEREEAGNRVERLDPSDVAAFLKERGFEVLRAQRYAMYYPHRPGAVFSLLSRPVVFPIVRLGWRIANAVFGRFGNKMVVVAERVQRPASAT
jgi:SAM-dependent methyltransferase